MLSVSFPCVLGKMPTVCPSRCADIPTGTWQRCFDANAVCSICEFKVDSRPDVQWGHLQCGHMHCSKCNEAIERHFLAPPEETYEPFDWTAFDDQAPENIQDLVDQTLIDRTEGFINDDLLTEAELAEQAHLLMLYRIAQEEQFDEWDGEITMVDHRVDNQSSAGDAGEDSSDEGQPQERDLWSNLHDEEQDLLAAPEVVEVNEVGVQTTTDQSTQTDEPLETEKFEQSTQTSPETTNTVNNCSINVITAQTSDNECLIMNNLEMLNSAFQKHRLDRSLSKKSNHSTLSAQRIAVSRPSLARRALLWDLSETNCLPMMDSLEHDPHPQMHVLVLDSVANHAAHSSSSLDEEESADVHLLPSAAAAIVHNLSSSAAVVRK